MARMKPSRLTSRETALRWAAEALWSGETDRLGYPVANLASKCESPVSVELKGNPDAIGQAMLGEPSSLVTQALLVRCRKCAACLRSRAYLWRVRAENEILSASRTWFVTLTLSPENHARVAMAIDRHLLAGGELLTNLHEDEQFSRRCAVIGPHITRYLKRIRKKSGAPLRFCLVAERHKTGLPHYHMLLHETSFDFPVRHRMIVDEWQLGFSNAKLADRGSGGYVAKYLAKASIARVRASRRYGNYALAHSE